MAKDDNTAVTEKKGQTALTKKAHTLYNELHSDKFLARLKEVAPKQVDEVRLVQLAWSAIRSNKDLLECSQESILMGLIESSQLGLQCNTPLKQAHLVPFKNKNTGRKEAQMIIGYRGIIALARRSKKLASIQAEVVHEKDEFEVVKGLNPNIIHRPYMGEDEPGHVTHAYAVARLTDVVQPVFKILDRRQIMKRKSASRGSDSKYSPWQLWEEEMCLKSAIRALEPMLPLDDGIAEAIRQDEEREFGGFSLAGDGDEDYIDAEADVLDEVAEKAAEGSDTDGEQAELPE